MFLEIRHLRTLRAIAESDSLATAAEQLHLTQSALSHQIRAIEEYYGLKLFSRRSRPMQPTEAGRRLLDTANDVIPRIEQLDRSLRQLAGGDRGRLYLALECHSCFTWLLPTLEAFRQQWPNVDIDLTLAHSFDAFEALGRGAVDAVICSDPVDDPTLAFEPLFGYEVVLALPPTHRLAQESHITPEMLADETVITYPVDRQRLDIFRGFLDPAGITPQVTRSSELTAMIAQWVACGRGVAALPVWAIQDEITRGSLTTRPLGPEGMHATLYLALRHGEHELAFVEAFIDTARRLAQQALGRIVPIQSDSN